MTSRRSRPSWRLAIAPRPIHLAVAALAAGAAVPAHAFEFDMGDSGWKMRWDNTLKYSNAFRMRERSAAVTANPNADDGDSNFNKGLISNRVDILSEFDVIKNGFGLRLSAAGWYDTVYNRTNDNPGFAGGAVPNQASVPYNEFTRTTRRLHGRDVRMLDAFTFGKFELGSGSVTMRLGQHSIVWGESLFLGANAIAGGMMPVDATKLLSVPNTQFKEAILPVPMASMQWQFSSTMALAAYYQFRYKPNVLPAVGSYFSPADTNVDGTEQLMLPTGPLPYAGERRASNSGQGGLKFSWRASETDLGFYAIRFHDKAPAQVLLLSPGPGGMAPSGYYNTYNENTTAFGFSASHTFGPANVAVEASIRRNQALVSPDAIDLAAVGRPSDNRDSTGYARGKTAHINISTIWQLDETPLWREATFTGEYGWNRLLSVSADQYHAIDSNITRDAQGFRFILEPTYRSVGPGLDLSVPIGLGYSPKASRTALGPGVFSPSNGGDISIGLNGTFEAVWRFTASYTHFFGTAGPAVNTFPAYFTFKQQYADRNFIAFSISRTL
jgi:hypothetical protein